jgi:hypothetical protein
VKRAIAAAVVVFATLLVAPTAGAIGVKAAGRQYVKDVAWTNSTADAEGERQAESVLTTLNALQKNLLNQTWPRVVKGGVRFICEEDISSLQEDLREIDNNSSLGNGAFQLTFREDSQTLDSDAFYIRRELGLPESRALLELVGRHDAQHRRTLAFDVCVARSI